MYNIIAAWQHSNYACSKMIILTSECMCSDSLSLCLKWCSVVHSYSYCSVFQLSFTVDIGRFLHTYIGINYCDLEYSKSIKDWIVYIYTYTLAVSWTLYLLWCAHLSATPTTMIEHKMMNSTPNTVPTAIATVSLSFVESPVSIKDYRYITTKLYKV